MQRRQARVIVAIAAASAALAGATPVAAASGSWVVSPSPTISTTENNALSAVTCVSTSECWAVGFGPTGTVGNNPLIERWDGNSWTVAVAPGPTDTLLGTLQGVTCVAADDCWGVGQQQSGFAGGEQTLAMHYDGTSWTLEASADTNPMQTNELLSVTCVSADRCWAVGDAASGSNGTTQPLIEESAGTGFSIVDGPTPGAGTAALLNSVACDTATDCAAVGTQGTTAGWTERWDGTAWSATSPPAASGAALNATACPGGDDCWLAGWTSSTAVSTLIARYASATGWTTVPSANAGGTRASNQLDGLSCADASDCFASGTYTDGASPRTLVIQGGGGGWVVDTSANASSASNVLTGVACAPATTTCFAVGDDYTGDTVSLEQSLIEQYVSPGPGAGVPELPWVPSALVVSLVAALATRRRATAGDGAAAPRS